MEIHIARDGQRLGPFSLEEVRRQMEAGTLRPTDFAWTEGAAGWVPLASFPPVAPAKAGAPPPVPVRPISTGGVGGYTAPQTSSVAVVSLVFGILSITLLPGLGGIVAVICGHTARGAIHRAGGSLSGLGMATAGLVLGYLSMGFLLFLLPVLAGIAVPVFAEVQLKGKETKSMSNAKMIVTACDLYALDHGDAFPKTLEELVPQYLPDRATLVCPLSPSLPVGYDYFGGTSRDLPDKVLLMSKFADRRGKRIVAHVDGSCALRLPPPRALSE